MLNSSNKTTYFGLLLMPFFFSVYFYFRMKIIGTDSLWLESILKCLPIFSLNYFLWATSTSSSHHSSFKQKLFSGLLMSSLGDIFLVWDAFIPGMLAFAVAHIFYLSAFGFRPLKFHYGAILYFMCAVVLYFMIPGLEGLLAICVPIYSYLLVTMTWRSLALMHNDKGLSSWDNILVGLSGVSWMLSDTILAFNRFIEPIPSAQIITMGTYYFGQLGMALSSISCYKQVV